MEIITGKKNFGQPKPKQTNFGPHRHKTKPYKIVFVTDSSKPNEKN